MNKKLIFTTISLLSLLIVGCNKTNTSSNNTSSNEDISSAESNSNSSVNIRQEMKLSNDHISIEFDLIGARIKSLKYDSLEIGERGFVAGRVANRIANGTFELDGVTYHTTKNENGTTTLHGGNNGFGDIPWTLQNITNNSITFSLVSLNNDNGFPGTLNVTTTYTLSNDNKIDIEYRATTDKKTIFNPTNHMYMNLNGTNTKLDNHKLKLNADRYSEVDNKLIPTQNMPSVVGTKFDYRELKTYKYQDNIDHNFILNGAGYRKVAELYGDVSKIKLDLFTDQPGLQVYNTPYPSQGDRICLETQHFPDAIHHQNDANWPSIILDVNEQYYSKTTYQFSKNS